MKTVKDEMAFVFTEADLEQFRVRFKYNYNIYQADICRKGLLVLKE